MMFGKVRAIADDGRAVCIPATEQVVAGLEGKTMRLARCELCSGKAKADIPPMFPCQSCFGSGVTVQHTETQGGNAMTLKRWIGVGMLAGLAVGYFGTFIAIGGWVAVAAIAVVLAIVAWCLVAVELLAGGP